MVGEKLIVKNMQYSNLQKTIALSVGVLAIIFLINFIVLAIWTEPTETPPGENIPAPINVGGTGQVKTYVDASNKGWLGIATDSYDSSYGLTVGNSTNLLGIKTSGNSYFEKDLTIDGNLYVSGTSYIKPPYGYDVETVSWVVPESVDATTYYDDPSLTRSIYVSRSTNLLIWASGAISYYDEYVPLIQVAEPHTYGYYRITVDGIACSGSKRNHEAPTVQGAGSRWGLDFITMCVYSVSAGTHTIRLQFSDRSAEGARAQLTERTLLITALNP